MRVLFKFIPFVLDAFLLLQSPNFLTDFIRLYIVKPRLIFTTLMSNNSIFFNLSYFVIPQSYPMAIAVAKGVMFLDCLSYSHQLIISEMPPGGISSNVYTDLDSRMNLIRICR